MAKKPAPSTKVTGLRRQAVARLRMTKRDVATLPVKDVQQLVHELQVYQIELEMQNTELRRTQLELEAVRNRYVDLYDFSPVGHLTLDAHGKIVGANLRAGTLLGLTRNKLIGQPLARFIAPRDEGTFHRHCQAVLKTGTRQGYEVSLQIEVGVSRWVHFESLVVHGDPGHSIHWRVALLDITERKREEESRKESEDRYRSIFENAIEGIFQTTLDGRFVAVNPALARMYGYDSPDEMIATVTDIGSQLYVDTGRRDEFIRLMQTQKEVSGFEALVYRKNGSFIWISENVWGRRNQAGVLVGYEGTVEHLTERKLAEERLRATLEEVRMLSGRLATVQEAERTRIARELHDELGVGLTCLKIDLSRLYTTMVSEGTGVPKKAEDKIRLMVEQVDATIASMQRLATELRPAILNDLGIVAAIEWQCQDFQKRTGIPCTCATSAEDIAMEPEPASALFRICQEALTNTARHAQATAVTVKLEARRDFLQLVVADNGLGIPETTISNNKSLGLLGMRERVAQFGGELTIQGYPGKGTTVTACLPQCLSRT
jgi:PAS domain S-box-containing protein